MAGRSRVPCSTIPAAWVPGAEFVWNDDTGALKRAGNLNIPLPQCKGDVLALSLIGEIVDEHPALFQIDRSEWGVAQDNQLFKGVGTKSFVRVSA